MKNKFARLKVRNYSFRDDEGPRDLVAIFAGGHRIAFLEYSVARRFVDKIHDLCDEHEREQSETIEVIK